MRRIGDVWIVTSQTLREMCEIAAQFGADEGLLHVGIKSKVREPSPEGGDEEARDERRDGGGR